MFDVSKNDENSELLRMLMIFILFEHVALKRVSAI